jgi:hypothetical protein
VLFCLKYDDPAAWADAEHNAKHIGYQALTYGRIAGDKDGTKNGNVSSTAYYRNTVTPVASFDFKHVFAMSHRADGSEWRVAVSRVAPGNIRNGGTTSRANDDLGTSDRMSASAARTDVSDTFGDSGSPRSSYEAARTMMISPYDNILTTGGDLYVSMSDFDSNAVSQLPTMCRFGTQ